MATATLIKDNLPGFNGHAALYRCDPPMPPWDENELPAKYVVVSAAKVRFSGPETYIFPADKKGAVTCWMELSGSYRGGLSHTKALSGAGYKIVKVAA